MEFNTILSRLKAVEAEPNVTITTSSTESFGQESLVRTRLKQAVHEAEKLLREHYDKKHVAPVLERLEKQIAEVNVVDARPGIVLFANAAHAETVHLPFAVGDRVAVGDTFSTRELMRGVLDSTSYHVLVLGTHQAKLYAAEDGHLVGEVRGDFPLRNDHYTTNADKVDTARGQEEQARKYHDVVDKAVMGVVGHKGHVVVATVEENYGHFLKHVENNPIYKGNVKGNFDNVPERELIAKAWEVVYAGRKQATLEELAAARESRPLLTHDPDDIWNLAREGRGDMLFVERDKHQPAVLDQDRLVLVDGQSDHQPGFDLVDAILEAHIAHGGAVRILPNGSLKEYDGLALKPRY